jgi:hypothetical protein
MIWRQNASIQYLTGPSRHLVLGTWLRSRSPSWQGPMTGSSCSGTAAVLAEAMSSEAAPIPQRGDDAP